MGRTFSLSLPSNPSFFFLPYSLLLAIESSCDETSAAVYDGTRILSNVVATQAIHARFGGVVPELASRAHDTAIWSTVLQALEEAGITIEQIDAVAVTQGPGLVGALLVGAGFAKGLALSRQVPLIGVNHLEAHTYAAFIEHTPQFPFLSLVVSGGHTRLERVRNWFDHELLGQSRDDAAGEAFDKIGKMLGLAYPAGREMDALARTGNPKYHRFPLALMDEPYEFSFSGLKTSALYHAQELEKQGIPIEGQRLADICASVTDAIVNVLAIKTERALLATGALSLVVAGGVSANSQLRTRMGELSRKLDIQLCIPAPAYCTDNAAMIAITGWHRHRLGHTDTLDMKVYASIADA